MSTAFLTIGRFSSYSLVSLSYPPNFSGAAKGEAWTIASRYGLTISMNAFKGSRVWWSGPESRPVVSAGILINRVMMLTGLSASVRTFRLSFDKRERSWVWT